MASDEIINEIWEVAQENSIDPIDKGEFGKDLRKTVFAELERATEGVIYDINNEFARALPIILHQAKANPELLYENNGKGFSVATGILAKAILTVKYENRFIPGTAEYKKEFPKDSLPELIIIGAVADKMIQNFDNLSYEERKNLNNNWKNLTGEQRKEIIDKTRKQIKNCKDLTEDEKTELDDVYAEASDFEDTELMFERMSPEQQAEFATNFLDKMSKENPEKLEQIKRLREMGLTDIEIRQMFVDNYMNLSQQANDAFIDFSNGDLSAKKSMMQIFRDLDSDLSLFNASNEYAFEKIGIQVVETVNANGDKQQQVDAEKGYVIDVLSHDYETIQVMLSGIVSQIGRNPIILPVSEPKKSNEDVTNLFFEENDKSEKKKTVKDVKGFSETKKNKSPSVLIEMIKEISDDELEILESYELKDYLRKKATQLGITEFEKEVLERMLLSREDDDDFADFFYDDREGFIEELEKMSLLQQVKKQPVTDQEYGPTYRASAEDMIVDSKGLYKAQIDNKKYNEYDGIGTGEGSDSSTTGATVVQDNDTLEVDTITTHQPMPNSFINTARREDAEVDLSRDEQGGDIIDDVTPEDEVPDNGASASNNSVKLNNVMSMAKKVRPTTDIMQEMGNVTTAIVKEGDKQQGGPEVGDESDTIQPGEIE